MMILHTDAIAENGAMGIRAAWVDSDNADGLSVAPQNLRELIHQSALPCPRRARDAYDQGSPGARKQAGDEIAAGARLALDQTGGASQRPRVAGSDTPFKICRWNRGRQLLL